MPFSALASFAPFKKVVELVNRLPRSLRVPAARRVGGLILTLTSLLP
jgi:hypothetical protein